jgi:hypothetical protein
MAGEGAGDRAYQQYLLDWDSAVRHKSLSYGEWASGGGAGGGSGPFGMASALSDLMKGQAGALSADQQELNDLRKKRSGMGGDTGSWQDYSTEGMEKTAARIKELEEKLGAVPVPQDTRPVRQPDGTITGGPGGGTDPEAGKAPTTPTAPTTSTTPSSGGGGGGDFKPFDVPGYDTDFSGVGGNFASPPGSGKGSGSNLYYTVAGQEKGSPFGYDPPAAATSSNFGTSLASPSSSGYGLTGGSSKPLGQIGFLDNLWPNTALEAGSGQFSQGSSQSYGGYSSPQQYQSDYYGGFRPSSSGGSSGGGGSRPSGGGAQSGAGAGSGSSIGSGSLAAGTGRPAGFDVGRLGMRADEAPRDAQGRLLSSIRPYGSQLAGQTFGGGYSAPVIQTQSGGGGAVAVGMPSYQDLMAQYSAAHNNVVGGYQNLLTHATGQVNAGLQGALNQMSGGYGTIAQAYPQLQNQVNTLLSQIGGTRAQEIQDAYAANRGEAQQSLISRGLGNTTVTGAVDRGLQLDRQKALNDNAERVSQTRAGMMSNLGLAELDQANRSVTNMAQQYNLMGTTYGDLIAAYSMPAMAYNTDTANRYWDIAQMYGAVQQGLPGAAQTANTSGGLASQYGLAAYNRPQYSLGPYMGTSANQGPQYSANMAYNQRYVNNLNSW